MGKRRYDSRNVGLRKPVAALARTLDCYVGLTITVPRGDCMNCSR
jgi:hypothetical protein